MLGCRLLDPSLTSDARQTSGYAAKLPPIKVASVNRHECDKSIDADDRRSKLDASPSFGGFLRRRMNALHRNLRDSGAEARAVVAAHTFATQDGSQCFTLMHFTNRETRALTHVYLILPLYVSLCLLTRHRDARRVTTVTRWKRVRKALGFHVLSSQP